MSYLFSRSLSIKVHLSAITAPALRAETGGERSEAAQCRSPVHAVVMLSQECLLPFQLSVLNV